MCPVRWMVEDCEGIRRGKAYNHNLAGQFLVVKNWTDRRRKLSLAKPLHSSSSFDWSMMAFDDGEIHYINSDWLASESGIATEPAFAQP